MRLIATRLTIFKALFGLAALVAACSPGSPVEAPNNDRLEVEVLEPVVMRPEVRLVEEDPAFDRVIVEEDRLVFLFSNPPSQQIQVGDVLTGFGGDDGYLRRATEVIHLSESRTEVRTAHAALEDAIESGSFEVVYAPSEGETREVIEGEVYGRQSALVDSIGFLTGGSRRLRCGGKDGFEDNAIVDFTVGFEDFGLDADMRFTYRWRFAPTGLQEFKMVFHGDLRLGVDVQTTDANEVVCEVDIIDILGLEAKRALPSLRFLAGPVPVIYKQTVGPRGILRVTMNNEGTVLTHQESVFGLEVGVHYVDGEWFRIWNPTSTTESDFVVDEGSTYSGQIELEAGIEYQGRLYGVAGPTMYLVGFIETELSDSPVCGVDLTQDGGVNAVFRGELKPPEAIRPGAGALRELTLRLEVESVDWRHPLDRFSLGECPSENRCSDDVCAGSGPSFDTQCCGDRICVLGDCILSTRRREGEACNSESRCARGLNCASVGSEEAGPTCCARADDYCEADGDCCGLMDCVSGRCQSRDVGQRCLPGDCRGAAFCSGGQCGFE